MHRSLLFHEIYTHAFKSLIPQTTFSNITKKHLKPKKPENYENPFLSRNTFIKGENTGGLSIWIGNGQLAFVGFEAELFQQAMTQNFDELLTYRREAKTEVKTVNFSLPQYFITRTPQYSGGTAISKPIGARNLKEINGNIIFEMTGTPNYSQCGLVTGILGYSNTNR